MSLQWVRIGALALVGVVLTLTGVLLHGVADLKFGGYLADVDHIIPMSQGGAEYARDNCQGLCAYHHALKSAQEGGFPDAA